MKGSSIIVLGSASARRKRLLAEAGLSFEVVVPDVPEVHHDSDPGRTALENALMKSRCCAMRLADRPCYILTADTVVSFDGLCINKPASMEQARDFLRRFSGKEQVVYTGVCWVRPDGSSESSVVESGVIFRRLDEDVIDRYFSLVDPMDKAGAYDIDQHGELIVESFSGSKTNIVGLPMEYVTALLKGDGLL